MARLVTPPSIEQISDQGKLIWTRGLPGCGKSTWAEQSKRENPNHIYIVSRDAIREMWGILPLGTTIQEAAVSWAVDAMVFALLDKGATVIVDATNLHYKDQQHWETIAAKVGVSNTCKDFTNISANECIRRDEIRASLGGRHVPAEVIQAMASRAGLADQ